MPLTPAQRKLRARVAAHALHAQGGTSTTAATRAFRDRFYAGIPDTLPSAERERRADHAFRAYMAALSLKASRARQKKAGRAIEMPQPAVADRRVSDDRPTAA